MGAALPPRLFMTHGPASSGAVCLTFDDGPHPEYTPRLLHLCLNSAFRQPFSSSGRRPSDFPVLSARSLKRVMSWGTTR